MTVRVRPFRAASVAVLDCCEDGPRRQCGCGTEGLLRPSNWSGLGDRPGRVYAGAGIQGWPLVSMTRASKKVRPFLAAADR